MKKKIHPEYNPQATVKCSCGNSFKIGSTLKELEIEICSACHPFYTGKQKLVDTAGRVDKYKAKAEKQAKVAEGRKGKKIKKAKALAKKTATETKTVSKKKEK